MKKDKQVEMLGVIERFLGNKVMNKWLVFYRVEEKKTKLGTEKKVQQPDVGLLRLRAPKSLLELAFDAAFFFFFFSKTNSGPLSCPGQHKH